MQGKVRSASECFTRQYGLKLRAGFEPKQLNTPAQWAAQ
jgi:hypothetical protein